MTTKLPPPPPPASTPAIPAPVAMTGVTAPMAVSLPEIITGKPKTPPLRMILTAVEGWGKTTVGAYAPKPFIIQTGGETGYETLAAGGRVPVVDRTKVQSWSELLARVAWLETQKYETIVIDAFGGAERFCHEHVCNREYQGDWGEKGFTSFQKGYDVSIAEWLLLLQALDHMQEATGATVLLLGHCKIKSFKNPLGADFDRYISDCHEKTWGPTHKWADIVLFGNFLTEVVTASKSAKKGKGVGGTTRVVYTSRRDAYDAKNRHGMVPVFTLSDNPADGWNNITSEIQKGQQS